MRASYLIASSFILLAGVSAAVWAQDTVNPQVTDAGTQANVEELGDAPALSEGDLYQAESQALSNAAHNATVSQQQTNVTAQAATTMGVPTLESVDTESTGTATEEMFGSAPN
ncbi:RebB family R body protein [uncultured Maricaulis sp.]|uniref:RebB family R body protein n=1 Tax=uncultured Maricaulis sp. TaxID=174710 RepID=UPI0030D87060|tara:strand:- start:31625 stop:31963 length:339 start_codon:yes stop_codon:yes gene_type:complete